MKTIERRLAKIQRLIEIMEHLNVPVPFQICHQEITLRYSLQKREKRKVNHYVKHQSKSTE